MKRLALITALVLALASAAFAHEGNEHVRGVITQISAQSITVRLTPQATKTLTLDDKTAFEMSGKPAHLGDLKVGDRVVVDVPEHTTMAKLIRFGAPAPKK